MSQILANNNGERGNLCEVLSEKKRKIIKKKKNPEFFWDKLTLLNV